MPELQTLSPTSGVSAEYAAGFFDGEGSVGVPLANGKHPFLRVQASQLTEKDYVLFALMRKYGGTVRKVKGALSKNDRDMSQWSICGSLAVLFLRDVLPFLLVKDTVANRVLSVNWERQKTGGFGSSRKTMPVELFESRVLCREDLAQLNKRGRE